MLPDARSETRIVPAIAVPNDEPRFETLRDSPEISPCCCSGKLDCTTLTDGVSITPSPRPISSRPGANATTRDDAPTSASSSPIPADGDDEAGHDQRPLRAPLGEPLGGERRDQHADRRRGEDDPGLDRVVAADGLQEDGDDERDAHQQQPLDVLGHQPEVRRAVLEQPGRQQRLLARALASADVEEEPEQERGADAPAAPPSAAEVAVGLQDPEHDEEHADRRQDRADRVERSRRVGRDRIDDPAAEQDDQRDHERPGRRTRRAS